MIGFLGPGPGKGKKGRVMSRSSLLHSNRRPEAVNRNEEAVLSPHLIGSKLPIAGKTVKAGARVAYHGRRWQVHVAISFPLDRHYKAVFG